MFSICCPMNLEGSWSLTLQTCIILERVLIFTWLGEDHYLKRGHNKMLYKIQLLLAIPLLLRNLLVKTGEMDVALCSRRFSFYVQPVTSSWICAHTPRQSKHSKCTPTSKALQYTWQHSLSGSVNSHFSLFDDPRDFSALAPGSYVCDACNTSISLRLNKIEKQLLKICWNVVKVPA